jgi:hypothetical protein
MFQIIISDLPDPQQHEATFSEGWQLLLMLGAGFLGTLFVLWFVIFLASYVRKHAVRPKSNLGASPDVPESPAEEAKPAEEDATSTPENK